MRGIFRVLPEAHHVRGQPVQRAHEQVVQREIDQRRGDRRDQQREQQDVAREREHLRAQRALVDHDLDEIGARRPLPDDAHHIRVGADDQCGKRIPDGTHRCRFAQIDVVMNFMRQVAGGEQLALIAGFDRHHLGAQAVENLLHDVLGKLEFFRLAQRVGFFAACVEHDRDRARHGEAIGEPVQAEVRDRRHIDQHFRDHHEQNREEQKLARQTKARGAPGVVFARWRRHACTV